MSLKIKGTSKFQKIEGGFWSIVTEDGGQYRPQMMPDQFQEEGAIIECRIVILEEDFGFQMWGQSVRIVSFRTIGS